MWLMRQMLARCAGNFPLKTAYICGDRRASWRQMDQRSDRFASWLQRTRGEAVRGATVAILGLESLAIYEHFFACMKVGAVRLGINTHYAWPEIEHVIRDSAAKVILVEARCAHLIAPHREKLADLGITFVGFGGAHDFALDYETILAYEPERDGSSAPWPELRGDDLLMYSYTSGTTGVPKGVMITQEAGANVMIHVVAGFGFSPDDVWCMPAASAWVVLLMNTFSLANGMTTVVPDGSFQIGSFLGDIERFRVTSVLMVPTMMRRAIAEQQARAFDLSSLRLVVYGSAPATPQLIREARAVLGAELLQTYGQTESSGGWMTVLTPEDHHRGLTDQPELLRSIGRVGIHFECSVRDADGQPVPAGERGELWFRGNSLMKGYLNLPEATAEALRDGWLRSNDIGRIDENGYVYLLDRQKFMIITGAVNVFPTTVEAIVSEHPGLQEVAVVGVPHPEWGEAVVAVAVMRAGHESLTTIEVSRFCDGKLGKPEIPKHVVFVKELPKTLNGKIKKAELREWLVVTPGLVPWSTAAS